MNVVNIIILIGVIITCLFAVLNFLVIKKRMETISHGSDDSVNEAILNIVKGMEKQLLTLVNFQQEILNKLHSQLFDLRKDVLEENQASSKDLKDILETNLAEIKVYTVDNIKDIIDKVDSIVSNVDTENKGNTELILQQLKEGLVKIEGSITESVSKVYSKVEKEFDGVISSNTESNIEKLKAFEEEITGILDGFKTAFDSYIVDTLQKTSDISVTFETSCDKITDNIDVLQGKIEDVTDIVSTNLTNLDDVIQAIKSVESVKDDIDEVNTKLKMVMDTNFNARFNNLMTRLTTVSASIKDLDGIVEDIEELKKEIM